jgi:predicted thioesterase
MPCEKYFQVAGTQESRTLRSNQLINEGSHTKTIQKQQYFRKKAKKNK